MNHSCHKHGVSPLRYRNTSPISGNPKDQLSGQKMTHSALSNYQDEPEQQQQQSIRRTQTMPYMFSSAQQPQAEHQVPFTPLKSQYFNETGSALRAQEIDQSKLRQEIQAREHELKLLAQMDYLIGLIRNLDAERSLVDCNDTQQIEEINRKTQQIQEEQLRISQTLHNSTSNAGQLLGGSQRSDVQQQSFQNEGSQQAVGSDRRLSSSNQYLEGSLISSTMEQNFQSKDRELPPVNVSQHHHHHHEEEQEEPVEDANLIDPIESSDREISLTESKLAPTATQQNQSDHNVADDEVVQQEVLNNGSQAQQSPLRDSEVVHEHHPSHAHEDQQVHQSERVPTNNPLEESGVQNQSEHQNPHQEEDQVVHSQHFHEHVHVHVSERPNAGNMTQSVFQQDPEPVEEQTHEAEVHPQHEEQKEQEEGDVNQSNRLNRSNAQAQLYESVVHDNNQEHHHHHHHHHHHYHHDEVAAPPLVQQSQHVHDIPVESEDNNKIEIERSVESNQDQSNLPPRESPKNIVDEVTTALESKITSHFGLGQDSRVSQQEQESDIREESPVVVAVAGEAVEQPINENDQIPNEPIHLGGIDIHHHHVEEVFLDSQSGADHNEHIVEEPHDQQEEPATEAVVVHAVEAAHEDCSENNDQISQQQREVEDELLRQKILDLEHRNAHLQELLLSVEGYAKDRDNKVKGLEKQLDQLTEQLDQAQQAHQAENQKLQDHLESEKRIADAERAELTEKYLISQDELNVLRLELDAAVHEKAILGKQVDDLLENARNADEINIQSKIAIDELTLQVAEGKQRENQLDSEVHCLNDQLAQEKERVENQHGQLQGMDNEMQELKQQIVELEVKNEQNQLQNAVLRQERDNLQEIITGFEDERIALKKQIEDAHSRLVDAEERLNAIPQQVTHSTHMGQSLMQSTPNLKTQQLKQSISQLKEELELSSSQRHLDHSNHPSKVLKASNHSIHASQRLKESVANDGVVDHGEEGDVVENEAGLMEVVDDCADCEMCMLEEMINQNEQLKEQLLLKEKEIIELKTNPGYYARVTGYNAQNFASRTPFSNRGGLQHQQLPAFIEANNSILQNRVQQFESPMKTMKSMPTHSQQFQVATPMVANSMISGHGYSPATKLPQTSPKPPMIYSNLQNEIDHLQKIFDSKCKEVESWKQTYSQLNL